MSGLKRGSYAPCRLRPIVEWGRALYNNSMSTHVPRLMHRSVRAIRRNAIAKLLLGVFDVERLRAGQWDIIDSVLDGKDTLAIMPTGSGKPLCYQIPAKILPGVTLVVSPLISLMKYQLEKLRELGIHAAQVNSSLSSDEEHDALDGIRTRRHEIGFCTPERLAQAEFLAVLRQVDIALVVIDEAHCISHWGHDFRPAYLEMAAAIAALGRPPVLALTATATADVVADIGRQLGLSQLNVVNTGVCRANLHYGVVQVTNGREKIGAALRLVRDANGCGIVYAATVKAAEEMLRALLDAGESATLYHGKLAARERKENQDLFMAGQRRIMVATNAFGMGIDKSDTRFVIHLQVLANLEAHYQESGRAGRDGDNAWCTLLFLQDDKRRCRCDNCLNRPAAKVAIGTIAIRDDEFDRDRAAPGTIQIPQASQTPRTPPFEVGARVKVPKFDAGVVRAIAGDQGHHRFSGRQRAHLHGRFR